MFLLDKPYISDFLMETARDHSIPVVNTSGSPEISLLEGTTLLNSQDAVKKVDSSTLIYTNSENSIGWISKNLGFTGLPEKIELFKNKFTFRELTAELFPDFFYRKIDLHGIETLDISDLPLPFIIKPAVGFFSLGVYLVTGEDQWVQVKKDLKADISRIRNMYPDEVLDCSSFIIEEVIEGDEYAIDAYFDSMGEPVILNILKHMFSSESDVSDRVYLSSKDIIEENLAAFTAFLKEVGKLADVKNFPCHIEVRKKDDGSLVPIEINPLRFGGWCTTADCTSYAYGFNPYLFFYNQQRPDWKSLLRGKEGKLYALIVLDNSTGIEVENIEAFDYEKLLSDFENPLELRRIDAAEYPVFGFLFTETFSEKREELTDILNSDLREYLILKG